MSDETVYEGVRFSVGRVSLAGRDGEAVRREVVRPRDAVVILPVVEGLGKAEEQEIRKAENGGGGVTVVMIRNRRWAIGEVLWELPAGTLEKGEDPAACAERELAEETGYRLAPALGSGPQAGGGEAGVGGRIEKLSEFYPSPGFCTEKLTLFLASGLVRGEQNLDSTEEIEVHAMPAAEAIGKVVSGEVRDAKTVAGLLWLNRMLCRMTEGMDG